MRICFISTQQDNWGGSEELWTRTALLAIKRGHEVLISVYHWQKLHPRIEELISAGAQIHTRPNEIAMHSHFIKTNIYKIIKKTKSIDFFKGILKFKPEITCVSQGGSYDFTWQPEVGEFLKNFSGNYALINQLNFEHKCLPYPEIIKARLIFEKAKHVFFVSKRNFEVATRQLAINLPNAKVICNPINLRSFNYIEMPTSQYFLMASVARMDVDFKGQDILFQILSNKKWKERNWKLNLYGKGNDQQYLNDLAKYYEISERVIFKGHINSIESLWKENHILVMPSIHEGTPLALLEAIICGRPAIVTNVGGNGEFVREGETGFIAQAPTPESFDIAMEKAWNLKDKWKDMGKKAHELGISCIDISTHETLLNYLTK
jgi:glycosyltransferase involved in cell wall biosynthesis